MRALLVAAVGMLGCGQMYDRPGGNATPPQQVPTTSGPPGGGDQGDPSAAPSEAPGGELPPPPAPRPAPPSAGLSAEAAGFVEAHNRVRAKHCAGPLTWSPKLADAAQKWANSLRDHGCGFEHTPNNSYGENLAAGTIGVLDANATVAMWYEEIKDYRFPSGGFSMQTGHFTQVVWRGTSQVGCGHSQCNGNDIYVCEYDPPGNYEGEYEKNVLPTGCK